jgi:EmrB/QacA subfamily drug resistance transporter
MLSLMTTVVTGPDSSARAIPAAESPSAESSTATKSITEKPSAESSTAEKPTTRSGPLLATVLIAMFMAVLDIAVVNVALPTIHSSLHASGAGLQLAVSGYTIAYAVLIVTGARLGDLWGHARMFRVGLVLFTGFSLACGLAPTTGALIGFRFAQGIGAAAMVPQVLSLIQRNFEGSSRIRATSMFTAVVAGGAAVGQVAGGLLISADLFHSAWRACFLINVPIGIAALVVSLKVLPKDRPQPGRGLDPWGVAVLTPTLLAFILPLVLGHDENWPVWGWVLLALSVPGAVGFVLVERLVERRGGTPVMPSRIMRLPGFRLSLTGLLITFALLTGGSFALTLQLQGALGYSALKAGLAFAPGAAAVFVVSMRWRTFRPAWHRRMIPLGFLLMAVAMGGMALVFRDGTSGGFLRLALQTLNGAGMGLAYSPLLGLTLARVPMAEAADASGVVSTVTQIAQALGVAIFGTLFLNLAAHLPASSSIHPPALAASTHAIVVVCAASAGFALIGLVSSLRLPKSV